MLKRWKAELAERGYVPARHADGFRVFQKLAPPFVLEISEGGPKLKTVLELWIRLRLPGLEPEPRALLTGRVSRGTVDSFDASYAPYTSSLRVGWTGDEEAEAREALFGTGIPWMEERARLEWQIDHWANFEAPRASRTPPDRLLNLSTLYAAAGRTAEACAMRRRWLNEFVLRGSRRPEGEPERSHAFLESAGCPAATTGH